jgi:hypothetical protein
MHFISEELQPLFEIRDRLDLSLYIDQIAIKSTLPSHRHQEESELFGGQHLFGVFEILSDEGTQAQRVVALA